MEKVDTRTSESRQQLLNRILSSRQFAHAHILKRILRYLCEQPDDATQPPKEYDIAVQAMGRPGSFDPRTDPIVRVSMASIRDRLFAYFATEGKNEPLRLSIPKGQYRAVFTEASAEPAGEGREHASPALMRFWQPYFAATAANVIVYTEPLFFRDDKGRYLRDWYVNDLATGVQQLTERLPGGLGPFSPSFHYLSTGEVHCMLSITRMFHEVGVPVETRNCRISSWNELSHSNLILLGSPRTNAFLDSLQGGNTFLVSADQIENRQPRKDEKPCYVGRRYLDGKLGRMEEHAVVTRRPGLSPECTLTVIAANHGRAIEGAGHLLTLEDKVQGLLEAMKLDRARELPKHFQVLMRVETVDIDDEVAHVECLAHRVLQR